MRVLVIGAGVGGATLGVALERAGIDSLICERHHELRPLGAGATLWTNAVRALQAIGLGDRVVAEGVPLERFEHVTTKRTLATWPVGDIGRELGALTVGITRPLLQTTIADALEPASLQLGRECTGVTQDEGRATAHFADGSEESADVVVGADGLDSRIRAAMPEQTEPSLAGITVWRAVIDFEHEAIPHDIFRAHYGAGGTHFTMYRVSGGRLHWEAHMRGVDPDSIGQAELGERFRAYPEYVPQIISATPAGSIAGTELSWRTPVARWGTGRVTLLGDAAHPMVPYGGQGACQAIEDAVSLARHLDSHPDVPSALRDYEAKRIDRTTRLQNLNRRLALVTLIGPRPVAALRNAALRLALPGPALKGHRKNMDPVI